MYLKYLKDNVKAALYARVVCKVLIRPDSSCSYLRVDAEVFSRGKGQSQEVVALSSLLGIKLHQLPQLLHDLIRQQITSDDFSCQQGSLRQDKF